MNDSYYSTVLRWHGKSGVAKHHGMTITLPAAPDLGDGPVWMLEYRPEIGVAQVQPRAIDPPRDMTRFEIAIADSMLRRLTTLPEIER
ncbi:MAG: hypothetical protein IPG77_25155 [Betaproteobacteria bacterium]|nr:hypothetical protein [Betaproteobacteria bacterium]